MTGMSSVGLGEHFGNSVDPRGRQGKRHQLLDIITMTIWAITGAAEGRNDVGLFAKGKYEWLGWFLELPDEVPCSDPLSRVFARIDPGAAKPAVAGPQMTRNSRPG